MGRPLLVRLAKNILNLAPGVMELTPFDPMFQGKRFNLFLNHQDLLRF